MSGVIAIVCWIVFIYFVRQHVKKIKKFNASVPENMKISNFAEVKQTYDPLKKSRDMFLDPMYSYMPSNIHYNITHDR